MVNAADKVEEYVFFRLHTDFMVFLEQRRAIYVYRTSKSKYKQDIELEEQTFYFTLKDIVRKYKEANKTLVELLSEIPHVVHAMARKVWT